MPRNKNYMRRIQILDKLFKSNRTYTQQELLARIDGVTWSQIEKDIKSMRDDYQAPIARGKYTYADKNFSIFGGGITEDELLSLNDLINILDELPFTKYLGAKDVIEKILKKNNEELFEQTFILPDSNPEYQGKNNLHILFEAARNIKKLKLQYQSFGKTSPEVFIFHPYVLKEHRSRWFIVGYHEEAGENDNSRSKKNILVLGLERISQIEPVRWDKKKYEVCERMESADEFKILLDFDRKNFGRYSYGVTYKAGEKPTKITLWLSELQTKYAMTMPIHNTQKLVKTSKDGSSIFTIEIYPGYEFYHDLRGWGENMKVVEPKEVKEAALKSLGNALARWEKG